MIYSKDDVMRLLDGLWRSIALESYVEEGFSPTRVVQLLEVEGIFRDFQAIIQSGHNWAVKLENKCQ